CPRSLFGLTWVNSLHPGSPMVRPLSACGRIPYTTPFRSARRDARPRTFERRDGGREGRPRREDVVDDDDGPPAQVHPARDVDAACEVATPGPRPEPDLVTSAATLLEHGSRLGRHPCRAQGTGRRDGKTRDEVRAAPTHRSPGRRRAHHEERAPCLCAGEDGGEPSHRGTEVLLEHPREVRASPVLPRCDELTDRTVVRRACPYRQRRSAVEPVEPGRVGLAPAH